MTLRQPWGAQTHPMVTGLTQGYSAAMKNDPLEQARPPQRSGVVRWIVYGGIALLVTACTAALRHNVTLTNTSDQQFGHVILMLNDRPLFSGSLAPGESVRRSYSALLDGEYVVTTTYEDGRVFWQSIGYVDPFSPSDARLDLGIDELTYNGSVTKQGSSRPRAYRD